MSHLSDDRLSELADGVLEGSARAAAERHLEGCARCREALAALAAQDEALRSALEHDPGEAYFESFAGRVRARMRAAGLRGAQARMPGIRGLAYWFRSPPRLALVGAVATVVVGVGIVMVATREVRIPVLREPALERRVEQQAPPPGPPTQPSSEAVAPPAAKGSAPATAPVAGARPPAEAPAEKEQVAPGSASRATASGAHEVRRNELGEDVPVSRPGEFVRRPPPAAPAPPAEPGQTVYARRPRYAEPLKSAERLEAVTPGAQPAPAVSGPSPEPTGGGPGESAALSDEVAKSAPAPALAPEARAGKARVVADRTSGPAEPGPARLVRVRADAFDALPTQPRMLARNALRLTALAATIGTAPAWDSAAAEWERALESMEAGPLERDIRFRLAHARMMAWRGGATERRTTRAAEALDAFLAQAPPGAQRDSALAWRAALKAGTAER